MYVKSLQVSNFRGFREADVEFEYPGSRPGLADGLPNVTLLLGNNGAGKTAILKAVALAVLSPVIQDSGYKPYYLARRKPHPRKVDLSKTTVRCDLVLHGQDLGTRLGGTMAAATVAARVEGRGSYEGIRPDRGKTLPGERIFDDQSPAFFLLGYGATRRVEMIEHLDSQMRKRRGLRYQRVAGLFEEYITLFPLAAWLPELQSSAPSRAEEVLELLGTLLPSDTRFQGQFEEGEPIFRQQGLELPFGALSDGYRAYVGLLGDLLYHLQLSCPPANRLTDMTGTVLLDDVDLQLHPSWQRTVVPDLAKTFPKLQFVMTSHSPLVAGTLHAANVRVIEEQKVKQYEERIHGLGADQILTSSYFNLPTTRSPEEEERLAKLSAEVAEHGDPDAAIKYLKELAGQEEGSPK